MNRVTWLLPFIFSIPPLTADCQKVVRGIVVDSTTLEHLPGVTVKIKNENKGAISNSQGVFSIQVSPGDTLIFSFVGYKRLSEVAPIQPDGEIMFVRLREESYMLQEVVIRDRSLKFIPDKIHSPTLSGSKPLKAGDIGGTLGASVNFSYFSKQEKEKRKLIAVLKELRQIQAYKTIIYNPDFKYEMMQEYSLTESRYYELLALFNLGYQSVIRSGDEYWILEQLNYYFGHADGQK